MSYRNPTLDDFKKLHNTRQAVEDIATFIKGYETENNIQVINQYHRKYSRSFKTQFIIDFV